VLVWLGMVVATALGLAPMIAVQPAFYAELFGSRVRYSGFAASRELGAALVGFSPLISAALVRALDGDPWLVAAWMIFTAAISLVAFLYSAETRDIDITETDPVQGRIVRAANVGEVGAFKTQPR
jgi:MFS transporter, MHS family, shikimate and dehydroshikimate transport protein